MIAPLEWRAPSDERPRPDRGRRAGGHDACPHAVLVRRALPAGRAQSDDHAASQDGHHQRPLDGAVPPPRRGGQAARRRRAGREQLRHLLDHLAGARAGRPRAASLPLSQRRRETRRDPRPQRRHPAARARHARQPGHDRAGAARRDIERPSCRRALGRGLRGFPAGRDGRHRHLAHHGNRRDRNRALRFPRRLRRRLQPRAREARHRLRGPRRRGAPLHDPFPLRRARPPAGLRRRLALPDRQGHPDRPGRQGHLDPADAAAGGSRSRGDRPRPDPRRLGRPLLRRARSWSPIPGSRICCWPSATRPAASSWPATPRTSTSRPAATA